MASISELGYKKAKYLEAKEAQDRVAKRKSQPMPSLQDAMKSPQLPADPKAEGWAEKNSWFGTDSAMTYTAFDIHKRLTEDQGFDTSSDEYYAEIDKQMKLAFPQKFGTTDTKESTKPVQQVASAKRSTNTGRRKVRLTSSELAIAKKLGVPPEEYAKQKLNITKEV
jgi:GH15 family glucan-1,4-alpha-glucosidase